MAKRWSSEARFKEDFVKRIVGLAAIFCSFSIFAFAAAPSDIADLVGTRATDAASKMQARGYRHVRSSTWWNDKTGTCVDVRVSYRSIEAVCMRRSFRRIAGLEQRSGSRFARVQPTGRSISESTRGNERRQSSRADRSHLASDDHDPTLHSRMHSYGFRTRNSDGREVKSQDPLEMHPTFP